jgi:hypothetical protein
LPKEEEAVLLSGVCRNQPKTTPKKRVLGRRESGR